MAKSESTAVNELINLVQAGSPTRDEPSDDLFGPPKGRMASPRMTATVPPLRGAGDVAPLPPQRAPTGTSQLLVNKPVRMMTAPPARSTTIPPLPQARASSPGERPSALPPPRPSPRASSPDLAARAAQAAHARPAQPRPTPPSQPAQVPAQRTMPPLPAARASSPPPPRASSPPPPRATPSTDNRPALPRPTGVQPAQPRAAGAQARGTGAQRTAPPAITPVAAPFEQQYPVVERPAIDKTGDAISADNWFEASRMVEKVDETWVGTQTAPKRRDPSAAIKKILLPLVVLSIVSAAVAYVAFDHRVKKTAPPVTHVAAPAAKATPAATAPTVAAPSLESANAATATAGGTQPEPPAPGAAPGDGVAAHPNANDVKIVAKGDLPAAAAPTAEAPAPKIADVAAAPAAPAAEAPAAPMPAAKVAAIADATPVVHEVPTAHGVVKLVDVRIDSKPAGATVMLVDNGKTSFLGTTPVAASVEPTRSYDVVLTLEGRPTQIAHLDPTKAQKLEITLAKAGAKPETRKARVDAPRGESAPKAARRHHVAASAPTGGLVDPGPRESGRDSLSTAGIDAPAAPKAEAGGEGTLMVSSKPPCEIWIDGRNTGLTTPQRSISLAAGSHKVTFRNESENITKTVAVKITADQPTKLIQNLMTN